MSENEEEKGLTSNIERDESFEDKMSKIQEILSRQKAEVEGRKSGKLVEEAPKITIDEETNQNDKEDTAKEDRAKEVSEISSVSDDNIVPEKGVELEEQVETFSTSENDETNVEKSVEPEKQTPIITDEMIDSSGVFLSENKDEVQIIQTPEMDKTEEAVEDNKVETTDRTQDETSEVKNLKEKTKTAPIIIGLIILIAIIGLIIGFTTWRNKSPKRTETSSIAVSKGSVSSKSSSSSSNVSSSQSSEPSTSNSSNNSNSSTSEQTPTMTRKQLVSSVNPTGERVGLDPNVTGSEPAFNFPENLRSALIQRMQQEGRIQGNDYKLIPASIINGQGFYNLYTGSGNYVASINVSNGYLYLRK